MAETLIREIVPGIWLIPGANKGRFPFSHSLYLEAPASVLIDAGAGSILRDGLPGPVDRVLLTHYHRDHVSGCRLFPGAHFSIHPADAPATGSLDGFLSLSGLRELPGDILEQIIRERDFHPIPVHHHLADGESFTCGHFTVRVLHTPGHTPGHCAFFIEEPEILFGADIDLTAFGPWYGNISSDVDYFRESIMKVRDLGSELFLSSHSLPVRGKQALPLLDAFAAAIEERDRQILELLRRRPMTLDELTDEKLIYGRHPAPSGLYRLFERNMVRQHLNGLVRRGLIDAPQGRTGLYTASCG